MRLKNDKKKRFKFYLIRSEVHDIQNFLNSRKIPIIEIINLFTVWFNFSEFLPLFNFPVIVFQPNYIILIRLFEY
jgi:hypothetical protein